LESTACLGLGDPRQQVAAAEVDLDADDADAVLAADLRGALGLGDRRDLGQRDAVAVDGLDEQVAEGLGDGRARGDEEAGLEAALALVDPADRHADAGGLDREEGVLHAHAVAGEAGAVGLDGQLGHAEHALDADVAGAVDAARRRGSAR
jgi:hypothetical protein